eukprot:2126499-Amphidinium_carterae.1
MFGGVQAGLACVELLSCERALRSSVLLEALAAAWCCQHCIARQTPLLTLAGFLFFLGGDGAQLWERKLAAKMGVLFVWPLT